VLEFYGAREDDGASPARPIEVADPDWICGHYGAMNAAVRLCELCGGDA
jgi:hypothetical protein